MNLQEKLTDEKLTDEKLTDEESSDEELSDEYLVTVLYDHNNSLENQSFIEKDYESVYTISNSKVIQNNKKIQFIKIMLNYLMKNNFLVHENIIIHSIYNYNKNCFNNRNKIFKQYALILIILEKLNIKFNSKLIQHIFSNIPCLEYSKKNIKNTTEILNEFKFEEYIEQYKNKLEILPEKKTPRLIKLHVNGYVFYIKNLLIIEENYNKIILYSKNIININNIFELQKLLIHDISNNIFCIDKNLQIFSDWICNIFKRLLIFNITILKEENKYIIPVHKSLDYQIQILINIFMYLIILLHKPKILLKEKYDIVKIKTFLLFNNNHEFINELVNNKTFYYVLSYIYTRKNKNIFSTKKFIKTIYEYFL